MAPAGLPVTSLDRQPDCVLEREAAVELQSHQGGVTECVRAPAGGQQQNTAGSRLNVHHVSLVPG